MINTPIPLPSSAKEYLSTILGKCGVGTVIMLDGRLLQITYSLLPLYDEHGYPIPEEWSK